MKLIIDIDDNLFTRLFDNGVDNYDDAVDMAKAIRKGTPLPKGHGNLIDANELLISERPKGIADDVWKESHIYKLLSNAQTIIEADKAERSE